MSTDNSNPLTKKPYAEYMARLKELPNTFSKDDKRFALQYWHGCCAYCGRRLRGIRHGFDHFIPVSDRSSDNPGTVATNMLPCCTWCNRRKHNFNPVEWLMKWFSQDEAIMILNAITVYQSVCTHR